MFLLINCAVVGLVVDHQCIILYLFIQSFNSLALLTLDYEQFHDILGRRKNLFHLDNVVLMVLYFHSAVNIFCILFLMNVIWIRKKCEEI